MKIIITILTIFSLLLISGCGKTENGKKEVEKEKTQNTVSKKIKHLDEKDTYEEQGLIFENDSKKPLTGILVKYYETGNKKIETTYKDGLKDGTEFWYYDNGNKKYERKFNKGIPDIHLITYYENGDIKFKDQTMFEKGTQKPYTGKNIEYYDNGNKKWETTYKNGKRNGTFIMYNENGDISEKATYKDGKKEGKDIWYYDNGNKMDEYEFKNGKLDGKYSTYDKDGNITHEGEYKDGQIIK